jgi:Secretion system C-terminal sorting domain
MIFEKTKWRMKVKNVTTVLIAMLLLLGLSTSALSQAWETKYANFTLTIDDSPNRDGVYEFDRGLKMEYHQTGDPIYLKIEPGVTLQFNSEKGLWIEGNVIVVAKGLPTKNGYIHFKSRESFTPIAPMINIDYYQDATEGNCYPSAIIEYCEFEGSIETAIFSESADLVIRYNRIHTDCNGIFLADDRYKEILGEPDVVFVSSPEITGNIIEGYGALFKYPAEIIKGYDIASVEYAGSGIYFHSGVVNSVTRNNILIQGKNEKGTGCGIFFRSLFSASVNNVVNNNVIDHIPDDNGYGVLNCGLYIGINVYTPDPDDPTEEPPTNILLENLSFYSNNNIFHETGYGTCIRKSNWTENRPIDLPSYIDYNDYYKNDNDMVILGYGGSPYVYTFGSYNMYDYPYFVSMSDVNYRLSDDSRLYDKGTKGYNPAPDVDDYTDIYQQNRFDNLDRVDMGAYSGGEECYRIEKCSNLPINPTDFDVTRSWSDSVIKDHNEFIIFSDNMKIAEWAGSHHCETSFIEGLPPVRWEFKNDIGIVIDQDNSLSVTHVDPSGASDPNLIIGEGIDPSWGGISTVEAGYVEFDNFDIRYCNEAFAGSYNSLSLNNGTFTSCSIYLLDAPTVGTLNLSNLSSEDVIIYPINIESVDDGSVNIENCDFLFGENGLVIASSDSPITINNLILEKRMSFNSTYAITLTNISDNITINNATITSTRGSGINISDCDSGTITINEADISFKDNGIYLDSIDDIVNITASTITGLTASTNSACVSMLGVTQTVTMDAVTCNNEGFGVNSTNNNCDITIENSFFSQPIGSDIASTGIKTYGTGNSVTITNNEFEDYLLSNSYAIKAEHNGDLYADYNNFYSCYNGIDLDVNSDPTCTINLLYNNYDLEGSSPASSMALAIYGSTSPDDENINIQGETITDYRTGIESYGEFTLNISDCNFFDVGYAISLDIISSSLNNISNCRIINGENEANKIGIDLQDQTYIKISSSNIETEGPCIQAGVNVDFSLDCVTLTSTGDVGFYDGIGIYSHAGFSMKNSYIKDCKKSAIKVQGDTDIELAPTVSLGTFPVSETNRGGNLIFNCGQVGGNPAINTLDHWMIDLKVNDHIAFIESYYNDFIIYQPTQSVAGYYGPCFGRIIDHEIDGFEYDSYIDDNYWGRSINTALEDGTPHSDWFSWPDPGSLIHIGGCDNTRKTSFDAGGYVELPPPPGANSSPLNRMPERELIEPNEIMVNSTKTAINSTNATDIKNALMKIGSLDNSSSFTTDQVVSKLSQWANPAGTTMLELESHRLIIRKLIRQKRFSEASAELNSWIANPLIMKLAADLEKLYLTYSRKLKDLKEEDPRKLREWYKEEMDKIYDLAEENIIDSEGENSEEMNADEEEDSNLPAEFCIHQSYPNPFNPTATLKIDLPEVADVKIAVFNIMGQRIYKEVHNQVSAGYKTFNINGQSWSTGTYFLRASAGKLNKVQKIVLIK